jgi:acetate kinase
VVHGGHRSVPARIDEALVREIEELASLAPNHNPLALGWIRAARSLWRSAPDLAAFDTAFFADLPPVAATYALPRELIRRHGLRRYGFHGLAHESMWRAFRALGRPENAKVITLQLGSGCSAAAIAGGRPLDTSMGFTPLEGLVMASRSGDLDPGLVLWLMRDAGYDGPALERLLADESGLLGLGGGSGDLRALLTSKEPDAVLALDVFVHRVRKYLGAYFAVLGGADAVLVGGGIGEHMPEIRSKIFARFEWAGAILDESANSTATSGTAPLHAPSSDVELWSMAVDEESILAELGRALLSGRSEARAWRATK